MEFTHNAGDRYEVTGVTVTGQRFKQAYENPRWALAVNLYRGSVWQRKSGLSNRKLLKRVWN